MPQAEPELRKIITDDYGFQSLDDGPVAKYLEDQGYVLLPDHTWKPKPGINDVGDMPEKEWICLLFLVKEWDYGSLAEADADADALKALI